MQFCVKFFKDIKSIFCIEEAHGPHRSDKKKPVKLFQSINLFAQSFQQLNSSGYACSEK